MIFKAALAGRNEWYLYLVGFILVIMGYVLGQLPLMGAMFYQAAKQDDLGLITEAAASNDFSSLGLGSNTVFALMMVMFVVAAIVLWVVLRFLHGRPFMTVINHLGRMRWERFFFGLGLWFVFTALFEMGNYVVEPQAYQLQLDFARFLPLLVLALLFIPIQASFEEWYIRGYLLQGVGLVTGSRAVAMAVTSLVFAGLHMMNPEVARFGLTTMFTYYLVVALFLCVLILMDGGLELAMGVHVATNLYGSLLVTFEGSALQTDAIFTHNNPRADAMVIATLLFSALFLWIAARRYGWSDWSRHLFGPVIDPPEPEIADQENV
jgi:membrane protease YdiL (CAAX protease family)